jgi:tetratricopeptide (TPR) repeat protein
VIPSNSSPRVLRSGRLALAAALLALGPVLRAADTEQPKSLSEATSKVLQQFKPLEDAKNYDEMLRLVQSVPNVGPNSYDKVFLLDIEAKIWLRKEQYDKAIAPWEQALQIAEQNKFWDDKQINDTVNFLAQICAQVGTQVKEPKLQQQYFDKAIGYFRRWLANTPKPPPEQVLSYASLLYYKATADTNHTDASVIEQVKDIVRRGMLTQIRPKEGFYTLLFNVYQQENDYLRAAEILEILVQQYPQKNSYWDMLMYCYLKLSDDPKDPDAARANLIRAIATIERAQALGHMKTAKQNMNLISLYLNAGQFARGTELLYKDIKAGAVENEPKNWVLLGYYYQQAEQPLQAISALQEATKLFPQNGQLELQMGDIYLQLEDTKNAFPHYENAVRKGHFDNPERGPFLAYSHLAYAGFELERYDEAKHAAEEAEKLQANSKEKDTQLPKLKTAIEAAIYEREMAQKEKADKQQKK